MTTWHGNDPAWSAGHTEALADLVVAWSLGLAAPDEAERAAAHAAECPGCASLARAALVSGTALAGQAEPREASNLLLPRIMAGAVRPPGTPAPVPASGRRRTGWRVVPLVAAGLAAVAVTGGAVAFVLGGGERAGTGTAAETVDARVLVAIRDAETAGTAWRVPATEAAPSLRLVLAPAPGGTHVLFEAGPAPAGHHYTLWLATDEKPAAVRSLGTGGERPSLVSLPVELERVTAAMVTIEPDGMLAGPQPGPEVAAATRP